MHQCGDRYETATLVPTCCQPTAFADLPSLGSMKDHNRMESLRLRHYHHRLCPRPRPPTGGACHLPMQPAATRRSAHHAVHRPVSTCFQPHQPKWCLPARRTSSASTCVYVLSTAPGLLPRTGRSAQSASTCVYVLSTARLARGAIMTRMPECASTCVYVLSTALDATR